MATNRYWTGESDEFRHSVHRETVELRQYQNQPLQGFERAHVLPDLIGCSAKQTDFARRCRFAYLSQATSLAQEHPQDRDRIIAWLKSFKGVRAASFWINNRGKSLRDAWISTISIRRAEAPQRKVEDWKLKVSAASRVNALEEYLEGGVV